MHKIFASLTLMQTLNLHLERAVQIHIHNVTSGVLSAPVTS